MKVRIGFVSNSSSSSFTLAVPKGSTDEQIRAIIEKKIGNMDDFFIADFRQNLIDTIIGCLDNKINLKEYLEREEDWLKKHPDGDTEERDEILKMIESKKDYYKGGFCNDGGALQNFLCETYFKIEDEDFFMENISEY